MIGRRVARFDNFVLTPLNFTFPIIGVLFLIQRQWLLAGVFAIDWLIVSLLGGSLLGASLPQAKTTVDMRKYGSANPKKWKPDSEMSPTEIRVMWKAVFVITAVIGITAGILVFHRSSSLADAILNIIVIGIIVFLAINLIVLKTRPLENKIADEPDPSKRIAELEAKAMNGDSIAQKDFGLCHYVGIGVSQDYKEAAKWYQKSAEQGNSEAQSNLAYCYSQGHGLPQDQIEAFKWWSKAAQQGHALAQFSLGCCYQNGEGVAPNLIQAIIWYHKAAEQGLTAAQCNLGSCYAKGDGVPLDAAKAVYWYRKAAQQGNAAAQAFLAYCYSQGQGVPKDETEAFKWWLKAAEQGLNEAQNNLGLCYEHGQGVPADYVEAYKWFSLAAAQGNGSADASCNRLIRLLSPEQLTEAYRRCASLME